jgi:hypothetical protein
MDHSKQYIFLAVGRVGAAAKDVTQRVEWVEQHDKVRILFILYTLYTLFICVYSTNTIFICILILILILFICILILI